MTLGEIIYMENEAHERDQINWACSAQNNELLPKPRTGKSPQKKKLGVRAAFDQYYAEHGKKPKR